MCPGVTVACFMSLQGAGRPGGAHASPRFAKEVQFQAGLGHTVSWPCILLLGASGSHFCQLKGRL